MSKLRRSKIKILFLNNFLFIRIDNPPKGRSLLSGIYHAAQELIHGVFGEDDYD
jgi:hypothetical protein